MEADGLDAELLNEHRGKQVLAGVLLHVIQAARPVDQAIDFRRIHRRCHAVRDALILIDDIQHRLACDETSVMRLPAGRRIKCCAIEV